MPTEMRSYPRSGYTGAPDAVQTHGWVCTYNRAVVGGPYRDELTADLIRRIYEKRFKGGLRIEKVVLD